MKQVPAEIGLSPHRPESLSHVPTSWQESAGGQVTSLSPTQFPRPSHASDSVQALLSEQGRPAFFGSSLRQVPRPSQRSWTQAPSAPQSVPSGESVYTQVAVARSHVTPSWQ